MRKFVQYLPTILLAVMMATGLVLAHVLPTYAAGDLSMQAGVNAAQGNGQATDLFGETGVFHTITNTLLFVVGAISVIMLVIGGLRYVISGGDSSAVTAAKNTILYAIIGIIIALLAYAAVAFVISTFSADGSGAGAAGTNV